MSKRKAPAKTTQSRWLNFEIYPKFSDLKPRSLSEVDSDVIRGAQEDGVGQLPPEIVLELCDICREIARRHRMYFGSASPETEDHLDGLAQKAIRLGFEFALTRYRKRLGGETELKSLYHKRDQAALLQRRLLADENLRKVKEWLENATASRRSFTLKAAAKELGIDAATVSRKMKILRGGK